MCQSNAAQLPVGTMSSRIRIAAFIFGCTLGAPALVHAQSHTRPAAQPTLREDVDPIAQEPDRSLVEHPNAPALREIPQQMKIRAMATRAVLQPSAKDWIEQQARIEAKRPAPDVPALESAVRARFETRPRASANSAAKTNTMAPQPASNLAGADVEELAFVVLMDATNDQDQDLQLVMNEVQAQTKAKQALRNALTKAQQDAALGQRTPNAPCITPGCHSLEQDLNQVTSLTAQTQHPLRYTIPPQMTYTQLQQLAGKMNGDLNAMSDMDSQMQTRLQLAQQQRTQILQAMSNIMRKMNDTSSAVISNLK
jgi:hypothetical protein